MRNDNSAYRAGVGIMLLNKRGEVFVARRLDMADEAWQMPQGGIDEGETPREAAFRELKEEIGTDNAEVIDECKAWLSYDLPASIRKRSWGGRWRGQRQKWFILRFLGSDTEINLATEHPEFSAWKWVSVRDLPSLVVSFKRQLYIDLLAEFPDMTRSMEERLADLLTEPVVRVTMAADSVDEKDLLDLLRKASAGLRDRKP